MNIRSITPLTAAGLATFLSIASAHATSTPNGNMPGQSARAGTQSQADMRAEYPVRRSGMSLDRAGMAPAEGYYMRDQYDLERADRPDRQR